MNMRLFDIFESDAPTQAIEWVVPKACRGLVERGEEVVVWADVGKIEASWRTDRNFYVGPGGTHNAIGSRYPNFGAWLKGGKPVEMSECTVDYVGRAYFGNGRHRFSWMRDHGAQAVPVIVPAEQADEFQEKFGTSLRQTVIRSER